MVPILHCNEITSPSGSGVAVPYLGEDDFGDLREVADAAREPRKDRGPPRYHAVQDGHLKVRGKEMLCVEFCEKLRVQPVHTNLLVKVFVSTELSAVVFPQGQVLPPAAKGGRFKYQFVFRAQFPTQK